MIWANCQVSAKPCQCKAVHDWKTHEDAFEGGWPWVREFLQYNRGLEAKTLFEAVQREHPRWDEFLDRLEGPEGCDFRPSSGGYTYRCQGGPARLGTRTILKSMGFAEEAIEASCRHFLSRGGDCDHQVLAKMSLEDEMHLTFSGKCDPTKRRQMFKHLSNDDLREIVDRLPEVDRDGPEAALFTAAFLQRGMFDKGAPLGN